MDSETLMKLKPEERDNMLALLKREAHILAIQNLFNEASEKCAEKCITQPGTSLSNAEKQCLQRCMDRFTDGYFLTQQTFQRHIQKRLATTEMFANNAGNETQFS